MYNRYIRPESKTLTLPNPHLVAIHEANPSLVGCGEVPVGPSFAQSPTPAAGTRQLFPHDRSGNLIDKPDNLENFVKTSFH